MEDAVSRDQDLPLALANSRIELLLIGMQFGGPALLPVVHHLISEVKLLSRRWIQAAEVPPDDLALVEHGGLELRVGSGPGHALAQSRECPTLQNIAPNRPRADHQRRDHHQRKPKQQFALEGHISKLTGTVWLVRSGRLVDSNWKIHRAVSTRRSYIEWSRNDPFVCGKGPVLLFPGYCVGLTVLASRDGHLHRHAGAERGPQTC